MTASLAIDMYQHLYQFLPFKQEMLYLHLVPLEHEEQPCVRYRDRLYENLPLLLDRVPELGHVDQLTVFAQVVNFMATAGMFLYIEHPRAFRVEYARRFDQVDQVIEPAYQRYGPYDVAEVRDPTLEDETLVFYTYQRHSFVPYRVTCPWPRITAADDIPYELLPFPRNDG